MRSQKKINMNTYIALLRGINVGGHKKILMADLRALFESMGFKDVQTYIQSGNVVFSSEEKLRLGDIISEAIFKKYGFEVPVLIKEPSDLVEILEKCPFKEEQKENSYFTLLFKTPDKKLTEDVQSFSYPDEEFFITRSCIYFHSENYRKTKFNNNFFERKLKVISTARNYRTIVKLISLSS